jgi:hypothetical protein
VGVALHGVFFYEELDTLVEGSRDGGRLLAEEYLDGIVGGEAHDVLGALGPTAAFRVRAVGHAILEMVRTLSGLLCFQIRLSFAQRFTTYSNII